MLKHQDSACPLHTDDEDGDEDWSSSDPSLSTNHVPVSWHLFFLTNPNNNARQALMLPAEKTEPRHN